MSDKFKSQYKNNEVATVVQRSKILQATRKETRRKHFLKNRSTFKEPEPAKPVQVDVRRTKLEKWKQDKQKRLEAQKKSAKPVFKVCRVPTELTAASINLPTANPYNSVRSKINTGLKPKTKTPPAPPVGHLEQTQVRVTRATAKKNNIELIPGLITERQLAPDNYKFCVPRIIDKLKPLKNPTVNRSKLKKQAAIDFGFSDTQSLMRETTFFDQANIHSSTLLPMLETLTIQQPEMVTIDLTDSPNQGNLDPDHQDQLSTNSLTNTSPTSRPALSPTDSETQPEENKHESPKVKQYDEFKNPYYFEEMLDSEINRLLSKCDVWSTILMSEEVSVESARDEIDSTIGQTRLLLSKKFEQFRGLIHTCKQRDGDMQVTCEDLQGFWDMIYMQVENLDARFAKLDVLRSKDWVETIPAPIQPIKKKIFTKKVWKSEPSSGIRALMQAARKLAKEESLKNQDVVITSSNNENTTEKIQDCAAQEKVEMRVRNLRSMAVTKFIKGAKKKHTATTENQQNTLEGNSSTSNSPIKSTIKTPLRINVIQEEKRRPSSPGLTMMKATMFAKIAENGISFATSPQPSVSSKLDSTPGRSILRTPMSVTKSVHKQKSVVFSEIDNEYPNIENTPPKNSSTDLINFDTPKSQVAERRKSGRTRKSDHVQGLL